MTIAGSDSGGGAGIQADLKTFAAQGVYGVSVITALTAQNTVEVAGVMAVDPEFIALQIRTVLQDIPVAATKTGMLFNSDIVRTVAQAVKERNIKNLVVDPVMVSKSKATLLDEKAVDTMIEELLPLCLCVTPNIPEAERITGMKIKNVDQMKEAAEKISALGPKSVILKGGHLPPGDFVTDIALIDGDFLEFSRKWINTTNTHGTGCTFSAAITAGSARGLEMSMAVRVAQMYIGRTLELSWSLGKGAGPVEHFF